MSNFVGVSSSVLDSIQDNSIQDICVVVFFQYKIEFYFIEWTSKAVFSRKTCIFTIGDRILFHRMDTKSSIFTPKPVFSLLAIEFYFTEWTSKAVFSRLAVANSENTVLGIHE